MNPRRAAHEQGRHSVPQIDCGPCWKAGHFSEVKRLPETDGLWHTGQHSGCGSCASFIEARDNPPMPEYLEERE